ncbi:cell shape-determining protein MreC [bacterium BMS3Bbin14]|nr:cell shape-determining protein MreC [bacterium BMS3Bbin14]HDO30051.1 rod shape-determining protein MreC [Desulfobacteraceae bacterium]
MRKRGTRKSSRRFRTFRLVLLSGLLLTLVLIVLVSTLGSQKFGTFHKLAFETTGPFLKVFSGTTRYFSKITDQYIALVHVRAENKRLWDELQVCRASAYRNREAVATNVRLRKLLDFKKKLNLPMVSAQVIGKDPSLWFRTVVIDRGTSDGVMKGMPVVTDSGIVGQIFSVSPNYAKVLLAIAPSSALDVLLQKSRVRGILKGTGSLTCKLDYVLKTVDVEKGDYIVTAGYGGIFPTGLPVGVVTKVVKKPRGMFQEIEVSPAVDFLTLENVQILELERSFAE